LPEELIGNNSLVELPQNFLQKIVCTQKSCSLSSELGRNGLWLGRDMDDVKAKIVDHNLLTHKIFNLGMYVGDKIELRCRACSNYKFNGWLNNFNGWQNHFDQGHSKILSLQSGLEKTEIIKPPPTGALYVGGIFLDTTESELHQLFSAYGNVKKVEIVLDKKSGVNAGYGFVFFETEEAARRLVQNEAGNIKLKERKLKIALKKTEITKHSPTRTLYVGGITSNTKESDLRQLFSAYGNVRSTKIALDKKAGDSFRYGFVFFETQDEAGRLLQSEADNIMLNGRKLIINPAIEKYHYSR